MPPPWRVWVRVEFREGQPIITRGTYEAPTDCLPVISRVLPDLEMQYLDHKVRPLDDGKAVSVSSHDPELEEVALGLARAEVTLQQREHLIVVRHWRERRVVIRQGHRPLALVTHLNDEACVSLRTTLRRFAIPEPSIEEAILEAERLLALPVSDHVDLHAVYRGPPPSTPFGLANYGADLVHATLAYGGQITLGQLLGLWPAWRRGLILSQLQDRIEDGDLQVDSPGPPEQWTSRTRITPTPEYLHEQNQPPLPSDRAYYTRTQVRQRGWTPEQIDTVLGEPDHMHTRRRGHSWRY